MHGFYQYPQVGYGDVRLVQARPLGGGLYGMVPGARVVTTVRVGGAEWRCAGSVRTRAELLAMALDGFSWAYCLAEGLIRVAGPQGLPVTFDARYAGGDVPWPEAA